MLSLGHRPLRGAPTARAPLLALSVRLAQHRTHASTQPNRSSGAPISVSVISEPTEAPRVELVSVVETSSSPRPAAPAFRSPAAHPAFIFSTIGLYSLVALDVFDPHSLHLLQPVDQWVHQAAQSLQTALDPDLRRLLFGHVLSNGSSMLASLGWIFATATAMSRRSPLAWKACAIAWALWVFGVGPIEHDPALMEALKSGFGRVRPSTIKHTPSFPSGHAACVALLVGALLFVLLPVVYGSKNSSRARGGGGGAGEEGGGDGGGGGEDAAAQRQHPIFELIYSVQHSWALWALATATTIVGRVGLDVHWLSDTLAGAALGAALVSGLAVVTERLAAEGDARDGQRRQRQRAESGSGLN